MCSYSQIQSPMHMTHVVEKCMECTIVVCQLDSNDLETWDATTVDEMVHHLWQYEENLSFSQRTCFSAVERLSQEFQQFKADMSYSPPVWNSILSINSKHSFAREGEYRRYSPMGTLWFYLWDHREDMRKRDGKSTFTLEAQVCELQGKTITNGSSSRKVAAPVFTGQFSRESGRADLIPGPIERNYNPFFQEESGAYYDQD